MKASSKVIQIHYEDLPVGVDDRGIDLMASHRSYGYLSKPLIDSLVELFKGSRVVECYSGRGLLASLLKEKGVDIRSTSLRMGHDGSDSLGHVTDVDDCSVLEALQRYGSVMDYLLVCWPVSDESLCRALAYLPMHVPIVFIGEVTDYQAKPAFLGGCASDHFFESVMESVQMTARLAYPTPRMDKIKVYLRAPAP